MRGEELAIRDLTVSYRSRSGECSRVLDGVTLSLSQGEVLGVLGPSGSGKTTLALSAMGLLPANARIDQGSVEWKGRVRSIVFQEPATVLSPVRRAGAQVADVIEVCFGYGARQCRKIALERLAEVRFDNPAAIYDAYPHELSGGQRQRVVLAQAFAREPSLVVADEPTSALDSITQAEILNVMRLLVSQRGASLILITHDPLVLLRLADRIAVVRDGCVLEDGPAARVWRDPQHPYTKSLLACMAPPC